MRVDIPRLKISSCFLFVIVLFSFLLNPQASAQTGLDLDLKTINIDELTDEQIASYIKQAESRGLNQTAIEALARQRGVSEAQLLKFRERIQNLGAGVLSSTNQGSAPVAESRRVSSSFGVDVNGGVEGLSDLERTIFGFGLFKSKTLSFTPNLNLPTPPDYVLGPGDELVVDMWGTTQQFFRYTITQEGTIRPNKLGPIYVNGLSIEKATDKIINRLSQIYSGLVEKNGEEPSIFYQVSLGNIRTVDVEVVGSVTQPGIYSLPSLATVYSAIHASGGPTESGTFRSIRLIRDNKLRSTIDIYSFLTSGIKVGDERLQNGDVIIVAPYEKRVNLGGKVKKSGLFEMVGNEKLSDLLGFASGFNSEAYRDLVTVKRNGNVEREIFDVSSDQYDSFILQDGDVIQVSETLDRFSNRVVIAGAVQREGEYQLTSGMSLKQLIEKAGGIRGDVFLERATIYRTNGDFSQSTIPVNLGELLQGTVDDVTLINEDVVNISSIYDLGEEYYVQISGEVLENGIYPFFNQMTIKDLIVLAGGLKESASGAFVEISRRNDKGSINSMAEILSLTISEDLSLTSGEEEVLIRPFDQVYIRKSLGYGVQQQMTVEGEVLAPGSYTISRKDERISDIIKRAKGPTPYAHLEGAILIRQTEFKRNMVRDLVDQSELESLRQKILSGQSQMKNGDQSELLKRIDRLSNQVERANSVDLQGRDFKQGLIEGLGKRDSSVAEGPVLDTREPVAIDLAEILRSPGGKHDLVIKEGDIISIPAKLETVRVTGEVTSPINVRYDESYNFKDYINFSGGFMSSARKGRSFVQYPNGERRGVRRFLFFKKYPKVEAGSTIYISRKLERQPVNLQTIIATTGSLATLALVIDRLSN